MTYRVTLYHCKSSQPQTPTAVHSTWHLRHPQTLKIPDGSKTPSIPKKFMKLHSSFVLQNLVSLSCLLKHTAANYVCFYDTGNY